MSETAFSYVPMDRRAALAAGRDLPTAVRGSAMDADLSGFTALTETLARQLGEQRGAEELARRLNALYDGLIRLVHEYGGTVLGFAGDAFSAWFDGDDGLRVVACGEALQRWMNEHAEEACGGLKPPRLKVATATGTTRRYLVGDPTVQLLEGLAGALPDELAAAGHDALPDEVVLAPSTQESLGDKVSTGERGVLLELRADVPPLPWPTPAESDDDTEAVRPWVLPPVYGRLQTGQGDFIAELRPATALFLRMSGIAYEADPDALQRLDTFVRRVQAILTSYEATLIQLTLGDKGSYLYAAFGAPVAHEDDQLRALLAALELRELGGSEALVDPVSIGVATGRLRAGSYGGTQRRTYGVLGDTVNLAARLMQAAAPGEVIVTQALRERGSDGFDWTALPDLTVKGKSEPIGVARLDATRQRAARARGAVGAAALPPMLGRAAELATLTGALADLSSGRGGVIGVVAEAGIGKSRLVAELARTADERGIPVHQQDCPSYGVNGSYVVWGPLWSNLLGVPERGAAEDRIIAVQQALSRADPALVARAPVLSPLLGLEIPETDLTRQLAPNVRKTALETTLATWLRASITEPTLVVLEDVHWIDPLSEDLLTALGRAVRDLPVLIVVTQRPRGEAEGGPLATSGLPHWRELPLEPLSDDDVQQLIRRRLASTELPRSVAESVEQLAGRAEGNPFYVEELIDWILELGPDAADPERLAELPSTLQSLVLSRIDRLTEQLRSLLKVASAVGRVFPADVLAPVHGELGSDDDVGRSLETLQRSDFVVLEQELERIYAFWHAITQEVAYSTIVGGTRASLHGRIGRLLEQRAGDDTARVLDVLALHFGRSDDDDRRRKYVSLAADAAQKRGAHRAAVEAFRNVLPLLDGAQQLDSTIKLGRSLSLIGRLDDAAAAFETALAGAGEAGEAVLGARATTELGELSRKQGRYDDAVARFDEAREILLAEGDRLGVAEVLHLAATVAAQRGDLDQARERFSESLELRRELDDRQGISRALNGLGVVAEYNSDLDAAVALWSEALEISTEIDDRWSVAIQTNNIGIALLLQGNAVEAEPMFERAVALQREIGDPSMLANFLSNLGEATCERGALEQAAACYVEALQLARELGELWLVAYLFDDVAVLAARQDRPVRAVRMAAAAARLREEIGTPLPPERKRMLDDALGPARAQLGDAEVNAAETSALSYDAALDEALDAGLQAPPA